jgi:hypothetical protein
MLGDGNVGQFDSTLGLYGVYNKPSLLPPTGSFLSLHLHQEEVVTWVPGEAASVPSRALSFSQTGEGKPRYLGYVEKGNRDRTFRYIPGVVLEGEGIYLGDDRVLTTGYFVLTVRKKNQM